MSSSRRPWFKYYPGDWRADQALQSCSLTARGLWNEMLGFMHEATPYGYLMLNDQMMSNEQLSRLVRVDAAEVDLLVDELEKAGVFSRDRKRQIYSRRMIRDEKRAKIGKKHAERRWSQEPENMEENVSPNGGGIGGPTPDPMLRSKKLESRGKKEEASFGRKFEIWWPHVPRKVDKQDARKAFKAAIKKIDLDPLIAATDRWAETCAGTEPRYIKHPARWLRGECWNNEDIAPTSGANGTDEPYMGEYQDDLRRDYVRLRDFMERGFWMDDWGPKPREDGCPIAAEVMAKYGPGS